MKRKILLGMAGALISLAAPAVAKPAMYPVATARVDFDATLTRQKDGSWVLDYRFRRKAPAWFFLRSFPKLDGTSWRLDSWTVETPGVKLERQGNYDVLAAGKGMLQRVRIRIRPYGQSLKADYTPYLLFSDGGVAVYDAHYGLVPLKAAADAAALPSDLNDLKIENPRGTLAIANPGGTLLYKGMTTPGQARGDFEGAGAYAYSGPARPIETAAFAGILDPGLPAWIRTELNDFTPRLFALYRDRLGPNASGRPMALVAWGGADMPGQSYGGSVLEGTVVMRISGTKTADSSPAGLSRLRWFIGHESAHFWMGQTVSYERRADAWITEGTADVLAIRALQQLVPGYDARGELQREVDDCIKNNGPGLPLSGASARGDMRTNYACGATLLLAAEAAARKRDPNADAFTWIRGLIDANRADGKVNQADWLAAFAAVSDPALTAKVRDYLDKGVDDPAAFLASLFETTGVAFTRKDGRLILA
ncbi:hypothetical protein HNP52_002180 [Sphingomonas kyeonggiensis]|uniref:Peptidase M1 membrane alanine aminopeptidase domain-containing protein n=1 Tax=Sphingomonas kyeonggiensis TaxID=1268553 RepID=A0A7W7K143_9SPHN|nr:hypothetical protein [Sphingomonas kyeonggiensis]MBB4839111.1 hypothetical protein [Sphingomonas kyeonggiensis]